MRFKSRLVPGLLVAGLVLAGGGSVIAASGGSSSNRSSSKDQYCPPNSPGSGQPQGGPGNNCGNPPETCPDGSPKPPPGNCGHPPHSSSETHRPPGHASNGSTPNSSKKPKWHVHRHPRAGCVSRTLAARIVVSNKPARGVITVLRDGRKVGASRLSVFKIHIDVRRLSRGAHTLKLRVRGADGKLYTRTIRFRRC